MRLTAETFHDGEDQTGVLLRSEQADVLATLVAFELPDGEVYAAEQVTWLDDSGSASGWSRFTFVEALSGVRTSGTREDGRVVVDGVALDEDAIPSYLGHRVLTAFALGGGEVEEVRQLDEHGEPVTRAVRLLRRDREQVPTPRGEIDAVRYDLHLDGEPYTAFWWDAGAVVLSDWTAGSWSCLAPDLDDALGGCPPRVSERARAWVAARA